MNHKVLRKQDFEVVFCCEFIDQILACKIGDITTPALSDV